MKFKPLLGSDLSGHIGGVVASHNTYGPYFRQRVRPVNPKSLAQQAQRASIAFVSQTWRSLNATVIAEWAAATIVKTSRKGDKVNLSGQAAYMNVNTLRQRMGLALVNDPPSSTTVPAITPPTVVFTDATHVLITFAADEWNASGGGVIESGALLTSSGKTYATPNRAIGFQLNPGTSPVTVAVPFATPIGARIRIVFHATAPDGRLSQYVSVDVTNPSFPPPVPTPRHVLEVLYVGTNLYTWVFDGPVVCVAGADPNMVVAGDTSGHSAPAGPNAVAVSYTTADGHSQPWTLAVQPSTVTPAITVPESGTTG